MTQKCELCNKNEADFYACKSCINKDLAELEKDHKGHKNDCCYVNWKSKGVNK